MGCLWCASDVFDDTYVVYSLCGSCLSKRKTAYETSKAINSTSQYRVMLTEGHVRVRRNKPMSRELPLIIPEMYGKHGMNHVKSIRVHGLPDGIEYTLNGLTGQSCDGLLTLPSAYRLNDGLQRLLLDFDIDSSVNLQVSWVLEDVAGQSITCSVNQGPAINIYKLNLGGCIHSIQFDSPFTIHDDFLGASSNRDGTVVYHSQYRPQHSEAPENPDTHPAWLSEPWQRHTSIMTPRPVYPVYASIVPIVPISADTSTDTSTDTDDQYLIFKVQYYQRFRHRRTTWVSTNWVPMVPMHP